MPAAKRGRADGHQEPGAGSLSPWCVLCETHHRSAYVFALSSGASPSSRDGWPTLKPPPPASGMMAPNGTKVTGVETPSLPRQRGQLCLSDSCLRLKTLPQRSHLSKILPRTSPARSAHTGPWVRSPRKSRLTQRTHPAWFCQATVGMRRSLTPERPPRRTRRSVLTTTAAGRRFLLNKVGPRWWNSRPRGRRHSSHQADCTGKAIRPRDPSDTRRLN